MKTIGLTGGIGSGKSTVADFLAELGAVTIDADNIAHRILENDREVQRQLVETFGNDIFTSEGKIDRKNLGTIAFRDGGALSRLNQILHPKIGEAVKAQLGVYRKQGVEVVVIEASLLIEAGWASFVDQVWVTTAPRITILDRLEKKGTTRAEALARIRFQLSNRERLEQADVVIDTDCPLDELAKRVRELWERFCAGR
jgi:dephospho-CoA kinase